MHNYRFWSLSRRTDGLHEKWRLVPLHLMLWLEYGAELRQEVCHARNPYVVSRERSEKDESLDVVNLSANIGKSAF